MLSDTDSAAARLYAARLLSVTLSFALWSAARPDQHIRISTPTHHKWLRSHVVPPHHHAATLDSNGPPATKVPPRYRGLTGHVRRGLLSEDMLAAASLLHRVCLSLSDGDGLLARHPLVHYAGAVLLVYLRHANEGNGGGRKKGAGA